MKEERIKCEILEELKKIDFLKEFYHYKINVLGILLFDNNTDPFTNEEVFDLFSDDYKETFFTQQILCLVETHNNIYGILAQENYQYVGEYDRLSNKFGIAIDKFKTIKEVQDVIEKANCYAYLNKEENTNISISSNEELQILNLSIYLGNDAEFLTSRIYLPKDIKWEDDVTNFLNKNMYSFINCLPQEMNSINNKDIDRSRDE